MANQRPKLAASEIESVLRAALQKLPSLRGTKAVRIRPYSGPRGFTWEVDRIEPEVEPVQSEFVDMTNAIARLRPRSQPSAASLRMTLRRRRTCDARFTPAPRVRELRPMKRREISIIIGAVVLAMQAALIIALHVIRH
jgi:hypothetical protein